MHTAEKSNSMHNFIQPKTLLIQLVQSTQKNCSSPQDMILSVLHDFFDQYRVEEFEREIWNLTVAYCGQPEIPTALSRSNTAYFCSNINLLLNRLQPMGSIT
jgi:hypothetical protein